MRDSVATQIGDQAAPSSAAVDAAETRVAGEPGGRIASDGATSGSRSAGRGRWMLWAVLSVLFVAGIAVSTIMVPTERNVDLGAVVEGARDEAQLATATLTAKQLTKPVTGSSYDKLADELRKSISSDGTIVGVTIWSSQGRILFSLNESRVGKTPREMSSLITEIAKGSGSARVVDGKVRTFTPVSKGPEDRVAIVEIDRPVAVVEAQGGDLWPTVRLMFGVGLAVSLLFLVLAFVRARRRDTRQEGAASAETNADGQAHEPQTQPLGPSYEEVFGVQPEVEQHGDPETLGGDQEGDTEALEGDPEALKSIVQWDEKYEGLVVEELQAQELMRQRREEFKARAEAAALRVKKLEAEPDQASPTPN